MRKKVLEALRMRFKPEFLNRVDEIIIFHPLGEEQIKKIIDLQIAKINKRLEKKGIKITVSEKAKNFLLKNGFDPVYGARPLKRTIQNLILDELSLLIIEGKIKKKEVKADFKNGKIVFN